MSNSIEPEKVQQVAKLARIAISEDSLAESAGQLNQILDYVKQLQAVDLPADVEPFFGAIESSTPSALTKTNRAPTANRFSKTLLIPTASFTKCHRSSSNSDHRCPVASIRFSNQAKPWI